MITQYENEVGSVGKVIGTLPNIAIDSDATIAGVHLVIA